MPADRARSTVAATAPIIQQLAGTPGTRPLRAVGQARDPGLLHQMPAVLLLHGGDGPQTGSGGAPGAEGIRQPGSPRREGGLSREMPAAGLCHKFIASVREDVSPRLLAHTAAGGDV